MGGRGGGWDCIGKNIKEQDGSVVLWHGHVCGLGTALYCGMVVCVTLVQRQRVVFGAGQRHTQMSGGSRGSGERSIMLMNLKNYFEFEQRKCTKEDIKEIIFREILEYLCQLLKDYMHGSENTICLRSMFLP